MDAEIYTSPWNVLCGAWLHSARVSQSLTAGEMAVRFESDMKEPYLRSIESGANALPSSAAPGLVKACGLSFEMASMLVAAIRMLDERRAKSRAYDFTRIVEKASALRVLWTGVSPFMDWLERQLVFLRDGGELQEVRARARVELPALDKVLRSTTVQTTQRIYDNPTSRLSPFLDDALQQFLKRLTLTQPQMTRESLYLWEAENRDRITAQWGVVSDTSDVLRAADTIDWSFLTNTHRPVLRIAVPGSAAEASEMQTEFKSRIETKLKGRGKKPNLQIVFRSYAKHYDAVDQLLWFDPARQGIVDSEIEADFRQKGIHPRYSKMLNCWIYQLKRGDAGDSAMIGMMDSYSEANPTFFVSALQDDDVVRWLRLLEQIHA